MSATVRLALVGVRRRGLGQTFSLVLVTALAAAAVVAGLAGRSSSGTLVDAAYEASGRPDVVLVGTAEGLRAAAADPDVEAASEPAPRAVGETLVDGDPVDLYVRSVGTGVPAGVGAPRLVDGRWPEADDEIVVERSVALEGVVDVGGTLAVTNGAGEPFDLRVVGTAIELSDCFYTNAQCDPLRLFGRPALVDAMNERITPVLSVASYRLVHPERAVAVAARLLRDGRDAGIRGANNWPDTRGDILVIGEVFGAMVGGFGAFLLAAACFVVAGATAARLVARRRALGLLRAVGFRPGQLTASVLLEHAVIGAGGVAVGWVLGSLVAPQLSAVGQVLDTSTGTFDVGPLLVALVLVEAFLAAAVLLPAWRAGRQPATEVLRDVPPAPHGGRWVAAAARRLGAGPSLVAGLRRAVARPVRAGLAGAAVLVAAVGTVVAAGFIGSVYLAVDDPARTGNPFDLSLFPVGHTADGAGAARAELAAALDAAPEVASWHTERETTATVGEAGYHTRALGGDPAGLDYRVQEGRPLAGPGEAIVGYGFLQETGFDVGDRLPLTVDGAALDLEIVGWYLDTADAGKTVLLLDGSLPPGALDEAATTFRVVTADGLDRHDVGAALRERLGDRAQVVVPAFDDGGLGAIVGTLVGFAVLLGAVAVANLVATTMAASRERARALGVLRTIGCTTRQLVGQTAAGAGLLGLLAGAVGAPLGWLAFRLLSDAVTSGVGVGPGLADAPAAWFLVAIVPAAGLLGAGAGALASLGISRRSASELVRYE